MDTWHCSYNKLINWGKIDHDLEIPFFETEKCSNGDLILVPI
jgi:hypothetical protein